MKKPHYFNLFCDVYGVNLFVAIGMGKEDLDKQLLKRFDIDAKAGYEPPKPNLGGCVMEFDKWPFHVLWLSHKATEGRIELSAKLSHEVFHHVLRLCAGKGIPTYPQIDNLHMDEPAAYLMEFYIRGILTRLAKP